MKMHIEQTAASELTVTMKPNRSKLGWSYNPYRASLYLDGERFAIVTPDGRRALSEKQAALLLEALNREP